MSFFRKVQAKAKPVSNFFNKASNSTASFFKKDGTAEKTLNDASVGFRKTANTLGQINTQADKVLNSNITQSLASSMGADGRNGLTALRGVNSSIGVAGDISRQASAGTNKGNYSGSSGDVINNALERSSKIYDTGRKAQSIQFE